MSENEKLREALEAWSKSIIMSDGEREIPIADIWAGYGGDVQHAAKLTREALSTPPSKADADDVERVALALMNHERGRFNMPELEWSEFTTVDKALGLDKARAALFAIQNRDAGLRGLLKEARAFVNPYYFPGTAEALLERIDAALQMGGEKHG